MPDSVESDYPPGSLTGRQFRELAGRTIALDADGFLEDSLDWDENVARSLAAESGRLELSEAQWRVIRFFREFYNYHGRAPLNRQLKQGTGLSLIELENLFPQGIKNGARRWAGLPNPKSCL